MLEMLSLAHVHSLEWISETPFHLVLPEVCLMHKIKPVKPLLILCLKTLTLEKRDVLACLPTGNGKSLAY